MDMAVNPLLDRYPLVKLAFIVPAMGLLSTVVRFILIFHPPTQNKQIRCQSWLADMREVDKMDLPPALAELQL